MSSLKQKIIDAAKDGSFLKVIRDEYYESIRNNYELSTILVDLHNQKKIDIVSQFHLLKNSPANLDFFQLRHILEDALPQLEASITEAKQCVKELTIHAGNDMASHSLIPPFIEFCSKDTNRINELLEQELTTIDEDFDHISTALRAGFKLDRTTYLDKAINLLTHQNITVVKRAVFALSRFDYTDNLESATSAIKAIVANTKYMKDEEVLATSVNALIDIIVNFNQLKEYLIEFLEENSNNREPSFLYQIAQQLHFNQDKLSIEIQERLFHFFVDIDIQYRGILEQIDWYFYQKIPSGNSENISNLLEYLLDNNEAIQVNILTHFIQKIQEEENQTLLPNLFTRWMLKKTMRYCVSAYHLVNTSTTDQIELAFNDTQVNPSNCLYLANKAIGWLNDKPLTALSLILSLISKCSVKDLEAIEFNTYRYLVINYPAQTQEYLESIIESATDDIKSFCQKLIDRLNAYFEEFDKLKNIKELRPSARQRSEYNSFHQKMMEEVMNKPSETPLMSLFSRRVILYGNRFISSFKDVNGKTTRQVLPFSQISTSVEYPSLEILTPHTFHYHLITLKKEGLTDEANS